MVWYGFVGIVWEGGGVGQKTSEFIHEERGGVTKGIDDWHG